MATYDPSQTGNYYILGNTDTETVHSVEVDKYFNRSIGGPLPEQPEQSLSRIHRVLDIACGPGGWVLELAYAYPHMQVTGFDISEKMIGYARVLALDNGLDNAPFRLARAMDTLAFP